MSESKPPIGELDEETEPRDDGSDAGDDNGEQSAAHPGAHDGTSNTEDLLEEHRLGETSVDANPSEADEIEENRVQENRVEGSRVEERPVDENPVEENPVDENPVDENPVQENPVEEAPPADEPAEEPEPELLRDAVDAAPAGLALPGLAEDDTPFEEVAPRLDREQLKAIVEALIFASPEPLTPKLLFKLLSDEPKEDVLAAVEAVQQDYGTRPGLHVAEVAGGFQITTRPELHEWVRRLFHERTTQKLSVAALETLSVVAYKQPITQAEIGEIRGVNASGVLATLLERHLVKIVGRKNVIGRPFLYGTTKEFLIRFGLKDLGDLPKIEDMAQQLGFEPPSVLMERPVPDEMLPLDEDAEEERTAE